MIDKLLRKLELYLLSKTRNKGYCIWDKVAMRIDDLRTWVKYRRQEMNYNKAIEEIIKQEHDFYICYGIKPNAVMIENTLYKQLECYCKSLLLPVITTRHVETVRGMKIYGVVSDKELIRVCLK